MGCRNEKGPVQNHLQAIPLRKKERGVPQFQEADSQRRAAATQDKFDNYLEDSVMPHSFGEKAHG